MEQQIGSIIKKIRGHKGKTQQQLASCCKCSKDNISKIERGVHNPSEAILYALSKYLEFDFITINEKLNDFESYEHYILTYEIIKLIQKQEIKELEKLLNNTIVQNEFTYGEPLIAKNYCKSIIMFHIDKDYDSVLNLSLESLNITYDQISTFMPELNKHKYYYSFTLSLGIVLYHYKKFNLLLDLQRNVISFFENNYFNNIIPTSSINSYYKKFYITMLNNYADTFFTLKNYKMSLQICEKAINKSNELSMHNIIPQLLKLKIENLCFLEKNHLAKTYFEHFKSICIVCNNAEYFNSNEEYLKQLISKKVAMNNQRISL